MTATFTESMGAVFTPPPSCSSHWTYEAQTANQINGGLLVQNAIYEFQDKPCYPTGMNAWGRAPSFYQIFSPGACPSGYTTAARTPYGSITTAVCCRSDFAFTTTLSARNDAGDSAVFYGCTSMYDPDVGSATAVFAVDTTTTGVIDGTTTGITTISTPLTMWGLPITVAYQERDLSLFTTGPITSNATVTSPISSSVAEATTNNTDTASSSPASTTADSSLSGDAIAGIAIGAAAVLGLIIGLAIFFKRSRRSPGPTEHTSGDAKTPLSESYSWQPSQHVNTLNQAHSDLSAIPYGYEPPNKEDCQHIYGELDTHTDRRHELG